MMSGTSCTHTDSSAVWAARKSDCFRSGLMGILLVLGLGVGIRLASLWALTIRHVRYVCLFRGHYGLKNQGTTGASVCVVGWRWYHG